MINKNKLIEILLILLFTIIIDQITKLIAYRELFLMQKIIYVSDYLSFRPVWNNGISFGMFQNFGNYGRFLFTTIAILISIWLILSSINLQKFSSIGYNLIAGGALGNAIDRIIHGKVIDFIDFHYSEIHWPAFNFADSFIFIGVILFLYSEYFLKGRKNDY